MGKYIQYNGQRFLLFGTIPLSDGWNKIYYWEQNELGRMESRMIVGKMKAVSHLEFEMTETRNQSTGRRHPE